MKKIIVTQLLLFIAITAFCQTTPTKEETIKWLSEKINAYGKGSVDHLEWTYTTTSTLKTIYVIRVKEGSTERHQSIDYDNVTSYHQVHKGDEDRFTLIDSNNNYAYILLSLDSEVDLFNRFDKALQNLVNYNKPKETY